MFKLITALSVAAMSLTLVSAASAATICQETAATNYAIAVAIGYPTADMVVENTMADCEDPMPFSEAMAVAKEESACYIKRFAGGWIVETDCDTDSE